MKKFEYADARDLVSYAKEAEGKYLYEIDKKDMLKNPNVKGSVGHIIETSYFGYEINSNAEADFADVGIELKATGISKLKNGQLKAKERLVLNIINYMKEYQFDFYHSSFWTKNQKLLLFFYEYKKNKENKMDRENTQIVKVELFEFPEDDLKIIKSDWKIINDKIKNGEAHLLSEGDTLILGACTKGSTAAKSLREQPFSKIKAKQRAYSIKQGYMTSLVRKYISNEHLESITSSKEINKKSLEHVLNERFSTYFGLKDYEIAEKLNIKLSKGKSKVPHLVSNMLGIKGNDLNKIEEFEKFNIKFKTINLNKHGIPKEHMSFEQIDFHEYLNTPWENSELKEKFETTKWLFIVFKENKYKEKIFHSIKLWNMPAKDINTHLHQFYLKTQQILRDGVTLTYTKKGVSNNLPGAKDNPVCHIRPKARDAADQYRLPDGQLITKQCFWLNKEYIQKEFL
ncbi:restriction endonuclease [Macrococcoides canis]|uniref:Sau3AI family type II restriction endonuclease n=1 Tax=Macrococcoides canis TaxID=1855823 RepID=UPI0013E99D99|nr:Sau3AI family type II restriction endonuclease [Macrococcus canis]QIH76413.1 restriction endonuclease [Macrococcus canis]